jgi:NAD(P)-dependent dehydrogenase (short-subunit alcohol dehydrogenase family)
MNANVAIVTGGAGRMGSAVVRRLARDGVTVAILDAYAEQAQAVAAEVMAGGGQADALAKEAGEDVADVAAFLLSDGARWLSAQSECASGSQFPC